MKFGVAIDLPAGPSELLVLADESSTASFMAADLLSQAEHGTDSQVILVCRSLKKLEEIELEISLQLEHLPRKNIASKAIENSKLIFCSSEEMAIDLINSYAPEHLILNVENSEDYKDDIINAGSVFLGNLTPESVGDYASGTNHTLPTYGYAKMYSGVNLSSYQKSITVQILTEEGLRNIGKTVETLAEVEELQAHKNAVSIRLKALGNSDE